MCGLVGLIKINNTVLRRKYLETIIRRTKQRGRDGFGNYEDEFYYIANARAEPTTEFVEDKKSYDQQPYQLGDWIVVHNGTIANDKELRTWELETKIDSAVIVELLNKHNDFEKMLSLLKGSYAIIAINTKTKELHVACNYKPLYIAMDVHCNVYFASSSDYFPSELVSQPIKPYTYTKYSFLADVIKHVALKRPLNNKALVVCSSGLDSTVALASVLSEGYEAEILHFTYGCKAETPEIAAIQKIADYYGVKLTVKHLFNYDKSSSRLFTGNITEGEGSVEYANEWVPCRNLLMLSVAAAIAESRGFSYIVLGNNLEEAGAYPDNEEEFIKQFNRLLNFAVADGYYLEILMPVGNLMKHEIVKLGLQLKAPLHLTWSCYHNFENHCGKCGPCLMRKKAFMMNNTTEVIKYDS